MDEMIEDELKAKEIFEKARQSADPNSPPWDSMTENMKLNWINLAKRLREATKNWKTP